MSLSWDIWTFFKFNMPMEFMNKFWIAIYSLLNECRNYTFEMNFWLNVEIIHFRWHRKEHKSRKLEENQQVVENNGIYLGFRLPPTGALCTLQIRKSSRLDNLVYIYLLNQNLLKNGQMKAILIKNNLKIFSLDLCQ